MPFAEKIRNWDLFGNPVSLRVSGQPSFKTLPGGFISILVKALICLFFIMQMIAVVSYSDPQISSFKIFESRNRMEHTLGLTDHGMRLFFCISD